MPNNPENIRISPLRFVPVPELSEGANVPVNSEIRKVAQTVLDGLKYSFTAVAAEPDAAVPEGSLEAAAKAALAGLPEARRSLYRSTATRLMATEAPSREAVFGRVGRVAAREFVDKGGFDRLAGVVGMPELDGKLLGLRTDTVRVPVGRLAEGMRTPGGQSLTVEGLRAARSQANAAATASGLVNTDRLAEIWGPYIEGDPFAGRTVTGDFEPFGTTDKLGVWIEEVRCVDETDPEKILWVDVHDEVALAGVEVDETGDVAKIAETYIGGGFDDGDAKAYPNWCYTWFSLNEGTYWPKTYSVSFILAEKDNGGLSSFLQTVWSKVREQVMQAIAKAVGGVASAYLGAAIGQAIGQAVAWVVGVFVQWIINLFGDDIFPVQTVSVTTPSASARWNYPNGTWGNPSSGTRVAHFYGHGGHYTISYHWMFFA